MSAVINSVPGAANDPARLGFQKHLQGLVAKIHGAKNVEEILVELATDIAAAFNADRLTIYTMSEDKSSIISRVKLGLHSFKDLKLPIGEHSIAGYTAFSRTLLNIRDVYDDAELKRFSAKLRFLQEVDRRTGYRTKQMLVCPILDMAASELVGVLQVINHKSGLPFHPMAEEGVMEVCRHLAVALRKGQATSRPARSKYDHLINEGLISATDFELAGRAARKRSLDIEAILIDEFKLTRLQIGTALSKFFDCPYEPFKRDRMKPIDLLKNLRREYTEQNQWMPVDEGKEGVKVLTLDPERVKASRIVNNILGRAKVVYAVTTIAEFKETLDAFYGGQDNENSIGELLGDLDPEEEAVAGEDVTEAAADNELVKLVNKIVMEAYAQGASDIHIESYPGRGKTEVRFRKDGTLTPYIEIPPGYRSAVIARIKIMCDLDISERRKPQDGKIKFRKFGPLDIELRVATIPTAGGVEDVVMRILAAGEPIPLDKLGLLQYNYETLKKTITKPYGIFFVCGPTCSGKTTTLHSVLGYLNTSETKIWTAEDLVEITQKGLRQVQVNRKAGLDFATVMRAFLRADPDIIMVGEMRDKETTAIGIEASLTGHLVFATLHTNSAPESIIRLLDMGMDPFNFGDALLGILAQRLAKRLCAKCKEPYVAGADEIRALLTEFCQEMLNTTLFKADPQAGLQAVYADWSKKYVNDKGQFVLYKKKGCEVCNQSGYKGRAGLHELLVATDPIKKLVQEKARVAEILAVALEEGMRTLKMDGVEK
ncbi:MAG: GspE/PulE family protein, partial [Burkholderiales bacterium]